MHYAVQLFGGKVSAQQNTLSDGIEDKCKNHVSWKFIVSVWHSYGLDQNNVRDWHKRRYFGNWTTVNLYRGLRHS